MLMGMYGANEHSCPTCGRELPPSRGRSLTDQERDLLRQLVTLVRDVVDADERQAKRRRAAIWSATLQRKKVA